ncbi:isoaspartyl peptidase/L-asparaginase [Aliidiomarina halalkaliphila]|uniref:Isoaspartyl peptidase n=1 Tax=Aliidiomarina halalkaliphila TaxID=2593535 RepID=A0A552X473_9GAMM|nr:isoaspartyl peptidase/L-asparaginase [Aliidiomarina halalkaliphila]TRW49831.1 isoaspartyl peptidase/L-asparaginase [Aliidiomarina halalkaliphila]
MTIQARISLVAAALLTITACSEAPNTETAGYGGANASELPPIGIVIHGGAGTITRENMTPEREAAFTAALTAALDAGYAILEEGGDSMDAVIAAIQLMEEEPLFNAGRGAVYTFDGGHELDASLMHGGTLDAGAVSGVRTVRSPIALAREVMENSRHVMLSAAGAEEFAAERGLELVDNTYFNTEHRYEQLQRALELLREQDRSGDHIAHADWDRAFDMGTVGAVALDRAGNIVAGTSTGGMTAKRYNRIGDSPIIGAGTWADNASCGVSATGHGEYFIRYNVSAQICSRVKYLGETIDAAGRYVIHEELLPAGGTGGVIIMDAQGNVSMPFNTEGMYRGARTSREGTVIGIYAEEE